MTTADGRHTRILDQLAKLGLALPALVAPVASYVPAIRTGNLIYTSGQLPINGGALTHTGKVGTDIAVETAAELARICTLNALAAVASLVDLDSIQRIVKVVGFVASSPNFNAQPAVINGASELLLSLFVDAGQHARSAVGVAELPLDAPVEIELIVEITEN